MTTPLTLIFMGTPEFSAPCLETLIASGHRMVAVYTQPPRPAHRGKKETPSPVHIIAQRHNIPVHTPVSLKSREEQERFAAYQADAAVVAAYGLLLPRAVLSAPRLGCINVHPSRLPRWRGAAPIPRSIMAGDTETACTIMQMNEGLDTGDTLLMEPVALAQDMDAGTLHDAMSAMAGPLVLKTLEGLVSGTLRPTPQPEEGATYAPKITKEECRLDWSRPGGDLVNQVRGLSPHPGAYFFYPSPGGEERIKVLKARFEPGKTSMAAGTVVDTALGIACGGGIFRPLILQRAGKNALSVEEFLRGFPIAAGTGLHGHASL